MTLKTDHIPISLYIHTPWCIKKCPYCDFNSHQLKTTLPDSDYIDQLITEFTQKQACLQGRKIQSIFIGGGTPSLLSPACYDRLLQTLVKLDALVTDIEITLEANPNSATLNHLQGYYQAGINRLSLGIQSFNEAHLSKLGRIHTRNEADTAITAAYTAGFTRLNLDIMFGLPHQQLTEALADLEQACQYTPSHISWYQLTIEPNTYFHRFPPTLPHEEKLWEIQQHGQALLANKGYHQYEISAYAHSHDYCQHNMNYWCFGDYLGLGAGAHSKITLFDQQNVERHWNVKHPAQYMGSKQVIARRVQLRQDELALEFMLNALRLNQTIPFKLLHQRTNLNITDIEHPLKQAAYLNLLSFDQQHITLSDHGRHHLNDVLELFLKD